MYFFKCKRRQNTFAVSYVIQLYISATKILVWTKIVSHFKDVTLQT